MTPHLSVVAKEVAVFSASTLDALQACLDALDLLLQLLQRVQQETEQRVARELAGGSPHEPDKAGKAGSASQAGGAPQDDEVGPSSASPVLLVSPALEVWYTGLVRLLKRFNSCLTQFNLKVAENPRIFEFRLDELYRYRLPDTHATHREVAKAIVTDLVYQTASLHKTNSAGMLALAQRLAARFGLQIPKRLVDHFAHLGTLIESVRGQEVQLVIHWCEENRGKLDSFEQASDLEFQLHRFQFMLYYNQAPQSSPPLLSNTYLAYKYANENFPKFGNSHLELIAKLLLLLLYLPVGLEAANPYRNLTDWGLEPARQQAVLDKLAEQLVGDYCRVMMSMPPQLALERTLRALYQAMPRFVKFHKLLQLLLNLDWTTASELPFETPYEHNYHPIFICPVLREQTVKGENPPMLLPCHHILAKESIDRLSNHSSTGFKCPYCPLVCAQGSAVEVEFMRI